MPEKKFNEQLGKNIRDRREKKKMTQEQLATTCGYEKSYQSKIETVGVAIKPLRLIRIAHALGETTDSLYEGIELPPVK